MERINGLCRVLAVCALVLLIGMEPLKLLPRSEAAKQAEANMEQQIFEIQTALNEDNKKKMVLFESGSLKKDYSQEQLEQKISEWVTKAAKGRTYTKEALNEVKKEIASLYDKQKEIASDPYYTMATDWIYKVSLAVFLVCSVNILFVYWKSCKSKSVTDVETPHSSSNEFSKIENNATENSDISKQ